MTDDHDERFHQHEEILRSMTTMLAAQHDVNTRVEGFILQDSNLRPSD